MAIRTVVTRGYGNGTFNGTIPLVVLRGYTSAVQLDVSAFTVSPPARSLSINPEDRDLSESPPGRSLAISIPDRPSQ